MSDRTIGILGLGIFGSSVLTALAKQDMNIIAIDDHAERINQFENEQINYLCEVISGLCHN